jgi:oxygen-independent coproporphyrinogen-3 oxidase
MPMGFATRPGGGARLTVCYFEINNMQSLTDRAGDLKRLVIDVPRYTSYPTAAEFSPIVDANVHATNLREAGAGPGGPLSLYVHLPFCRTLCHFCGCHAMVARNPERMDRYLGALFHEIELVSQALGPARAVAELHFGGGSPSLLSPEEIERLMAKLRACFPFADGAAIAIEADPRTTDREKLACYRRLGVGRISFGFQDLDENVQHAIGRHQSAATSRSVFELARTAGFEGINVDLCYGLPEQTEATFARTVAETIALRPDRVALFGYAHVPWMRRQQERIDVRTLPGVDRRLRLVSEAHAQFTGAGYVPIGFDHFALPTDSLAEAAEERRLHRNFQGYTATRTDALVGLGLSAISDLPAAYAQNARTLEAYYAAIDAGRLPTERGATRSFDDHLRAEVIRQIMCTFRVDRRRVEHAFGIPFEPTFTAELAALERLATEGLVVVDDDLIELTPLGRMFVRNVAVVFDAYYEKSKAKRPGSRLAARAVTTAVSSDDSPVPEPAEEVPTHRFSSSV